MPTLSEHDPEPTGRSAPPIWVVAAIVLAVVVVVVLHLTGVIGPG
jgi:hypothetical protein